MIYKKDRPIECKTYEYVTLTRLFIRFSSSSTFYKNYLDPLTQLMIYYKKKDMNSFNDKYK